MCVKIAMSNQCTQSAQKSTLQQMIHVKISKMYATEFCAFTYQTESVTNEKLLIGQGQGHKLMVSKFCYSKSRNIFSEK